jgi:hypothetical protein
MRSVNGIEIILSREDEPLLIEAVNDLRSRTKDLYNMAKAYSDDKNLIDMLKKKLEAIILLKENILMEEEDEDDI